MTFEPWIGVDLDGTLAEYRARSSNGAIGAPVPKMVKRVKVWLAEGRIVKIFTARVSPKNGNPKAIERHRKKVEDWCLTHIGKVLQVTCEKDHGMVELWDDQCIQVERNTGKVLSRWI